MAEIVHAAPPENHPPIDDGWDDKAVEEHIPLSRWQKVKISLGKAADKLYDGAVSTGEKIRDIRYSITFLSIGYLASTDIINDALRAGSEQRAIDVVARLDEVNLKYNGSGPSVDELRYHLDRLRISEDHDKVYREELARYNEWLLSTTPSFRDIANRVRETTDLGRDTRDRFVEEIETALAGMADDTPPIDDEALSLSPDGSISPDYLYRLGTGGSVELSKLLKQGIACVNRLGDGEQPLFSGEINGVNCGELAVLTKEQMDNIYEQQLPRIRELLGVETPDEIKNKVAELVNKALELMSAVLLLSEKQKGEWDPRSIVKNRLPLGLVGLEGLESNKPTCFERSSFIGGAYGDEIETPVGSMYTVPYRRGKIGGATPIIADIQIPASPVAMLKNMPKAPTMPNLPDISFQGADGTLVRINKATITLLLSDKYPGISEASSSKTAHDQHYATLEDVVYLVKKWSEIVSSESDGAGAFTADAQKAYYGTDDINRRREIASLYSLHEWLSR